jgi:hypothetical protein
MDEFKTDEADELPQGSATSPRWTGAPSIALAHGLNEQCVELVCDLAASSSIEELPRFILQNRDLWRLLEPTLASASVQIISGPFAALTACGFPLCWSDEDTITIDQSYLRLARLASSEAQVIVGKSFGQDRKPARASLLHRRPKCRYMRSWTSRIVGEDGNVQSIAPWVVDALVKIVINDVVTDAHKSEL